MKGEQQRSAGRVITVNGVTYRSPEEMPADVRAIWDEYVRCMEQRKIDWREQSSVDLTASRERKVTTQSFTIHQSVETVAGEPDVIDVWPAKAKRGSAGAEGVQWRAASEHRWLLRDVVFYFYLLCAPIAVYGIDWDGSQSQLLLTIDREAFFAAFALFCLPRLVVSALKAYRELWPNPARPAIPDTKWSWHKRRAWSLATAALLFLGFGGCFSAVTRLLHRSERQPGHVTLTVTEKHADPAEIGSCACRVGFAGFGFFPNDVCVDAALFATVKIGDRMRVTGQISNYAIEPEKLEVVSAASARLKGVR